MKLILCVQKYRDVKIARGVMANVLNCDIIVREIEAKLRDYIRIRYLANIDMALIKETRTTIETEDVLAGKEINHEGNFCFLYIFPFDI